MGNGGLDLLRRDGKTILVFERAPDQRASATLRALFMGGLVVTLLYAAVYAILHADPAQSAFAVPLFVTGAAFAVWNGAAPARTGLHHSVRFSGTHRYADRKRLFCPAARAGLLR
jgi:hypothetical protein